ncbi:D-arabinono-1,4-lactone oxidase [Rhodococcus sp. X156]|uniref:D-arabinono-1,4-lactone oxidase n=1 Tax=Rhodococcus sp. X156 TaxID=2499145 RepID=UPI000FD6ED09|nr:D-arabinono-1,4-lactone oxidase [Rhodococcus sp. X156]
MTWTNWAGNQHADPHTVARPTSTAELAEVVCAAAAAGERVKPVGSGHSFTGIALTDGVQVDLGLLTGLVSADPSSGLVTVRAGTTLRRLNTVLAQLGLAMTNLGDVDAQTLAGALSTGTHGTGCRFGGLATQVRALELVLADGSVVTASPTENPELFSAARVGLGALGVLSTVTLQTEPTYTLHAREEPMPLREVLDNLPELVRDNDHFELYWFPHTTATLTKRNNRLPADAVPQPLPRGRALLEDEVLSNGLFQLTCRLGRSRPRLVPRINRVASRVLGAREYSDVSHRVLVSPRRVRFVEMEYAVPTAAVGEALAGIERVIAEHHLRVSFPVEVRFAAADDVPLSTASGRDSAYLAVHVFRGEPFERYFRAVEAVMDRLHGRPHWGKMHYQDAATLRQRYPRFDEFTAVRAAVDPERRFGNDYLERVLG